ncbi:MULTISPECIES: hypothetical protein [Microbacterium]|uniref:hypothetical protein n=1 Tax=Microbacterium TaxID=33882 RepID=UPI001E613480|nr:hypothetical protein [Microbacterium nymphoidis]MCD2498682.1 hypothetical protein [Microbacterium nymphoidis]
MSETPNSPSGDAAGEPVEETTTGADLNEDTVAEEQSAAEDAVPAADSDDDAAFAASVADEIAAANAGVVPAAAPMPPAAPASVVAADNVDAARAAATSEAPSPDEAPAEPATADAVDATPADDSHPAGTPAVTPASFADEDAPDAIADPDAPADGAAWNAAAAAAAATESARAAEEAADAAVAGTTAKADTDAAAEAGTAADSATIADSGTTPDADAPAPSVASDVDRARAAAAAMNDDDDTPWYDRPEVVEAAASLPSPVADAPTTAVDAPTTALTPPAAAAAAAATTPVAEPAATGVTAGPAQIFVQAPEEPAKRGNRAFAGVVGLIATVVFAVLYMAATLLPRGGEVLTSFDALGAAALTEVASPGFWIPVATFFLAFWLLGAILNTAKWGYWVVFGLLVGLLSLAGHVLGQIIAANPWLITPTQALELARTSVFSVPGLVALVIGRELPVWFGGWIARRGRKVIAANAEAQEEFQRILDAGPQLAS